MASHQLAIAKASFSAGLLRPDPTSLSREDIAQFHTLLNSTVLQCTPKNVQQCKQWILGNIVQSTARFTAFGKYLIALVASFAESDGQKETTTKREPSIKRKRLHLLYLLNDLLYHSKYRVNDASICSKIQPVLVNLVGSAASFKRCPKHQKKVQDLLDLWQEKCYYSKEYVDKLRETVKNASEAGQHDGSSTTADTDQGLATKTAKSAPYVMPAMHGDTSTPWFDLPAGNLMPHIVPNSTRPINPDLIKPLQFVAGPADDRLVLAVKELLEDVDTIFGAEMEQDDRVACDIDELGQPITVDEITGDVIDGEGYYGWSRSFCEKMKRRRNGPELSHDRDRLSRSRSSSVGQRKRRYSDDDSSSPDGLRSTRRRRSYTSSRSPSPDGGGRNGHSRPRSGSYSKSPPPRSRTPERSELPPRPTLQQGPQRENLPPRPPMPPIPHPPFPVYNQNFPPPPPPPPPINQMPYNQAPQFSQWPPPPPPQMQNMPFNAPASQYGQWPPPPPPPPPGPPPGPGNYQHPQQQYGQYPPSGPGGWQQGNGRGYNGGNGGWNNSPRGRGNYRGGGRGW